MESETIELDELFTYAGEKKRKSIATAVDRHTGCIVGWEVMPMRTFEAWQDIVDQAPRAGFYFSDGFPVFADLYYHGGQYRAAPDKSPTYAVEAVNAELRHYMARLRRQKRFYSKCLQALRRTIDLFARVWNAQQLHRRAQSRDVQPLVNFVSLRV